MLPFLDLCLHKSPHNITFSIYRKPTTTDNLIPFDSIHPYSHKLAGLNALLFRLFKIPMSPTHFQEEYNIIKQIAANNVVLKCKNALIIYLSVICMCIKFKRNRSVTLLLTAFQNINPFYIPHPILETQKFQMRAISFQNL
ncbi:hypothetical protein RI129_001277 [Pyrocoelia pectoralis]|uniref:Helix-turn-helix domain-containing protein n=1 Tax=Pyrocoelia pectoralis TaxID=417401 RepID=A0AAN7VWB4_9COLE